MQARVSIFVEGQTERIFVEKLLDEYLSVQNFTIESRRLIGETAIRLAVRIVDGKAPLYILIFDVGGDGGLTSAILERGKNLLDQSGYSFLLGLRDLYDIPREDKEKTYRQTEERLLKEGLDGKVKIVFSVMEIEAWFLAEYSVFEKIDKKLTPEFIKEQLNKDLVADDPEIYSKPSNVVDAIYRLVGRRYKKKIDDSYAIATRIEYDTLCMGNETKGKIASFKYFLKQLDRICEIAGI